jgi:hypothetical protein
MRDYIQNFDKQDLTELVLASTFVAIIFQVLYIVQGL